MAADLIGIRLDSLEMSGGAVHDALAAVLFCRSNRVDFNVVNGEVLVEHGALTRLDVERIVAQHNVLARQLFRS
jgi:hypothetical protein